LVVLVKQLAVGHDSARGDEVRVTVEYDDAIVRVWAVHGMPQRADGNVQPMGREGFVGFRPEQFSQLLARKVPPRMCHEVAADLHSWLTSSKIELYIFSEERKDTKIRRI